MPGVGNMDKAGHSHNRHATLLRLYCVLVLLGIEKPNSAIIKPIGHGWNIFYAGLVPLFLAIVSEVLAASTLKAP